MGNNLHVSYDLINPGQNYDAVIEKIKTLGGWAKIHKSFWYVNSNHTAAEAVDIVWAVMDKNDTIYISDATNNNASWQNIAKDATNFIKDKWHN